MTTGIALVLAAGLVTGGLIGAVGVGGVLIAPLLVLLAGYDVQQAIAIAAGSFVFTGLAGTLAYARRGSVDWPAAGWLAAGVVPGALVGAWISGLLPAEALTWLICTLIALLGVRELFGRRVRPDRLGRMPGVYTLLPLGTAVGFGSALTGTGGPVLLIPLLLMATVPALAAIGVAQVIQLPVALFASLGFLLFGQIDLLLAAGLGVTQAAGVLLGARLAHSLPARLLRRLVAIALLGTAVLLLVRL